MDSKLIWESYINAAHKFKLEYAEDHVLVIDLTTNESIGGADYRVEHILQRNANNFFPELNITTPCLRIGGIHLDENYHGGKIGQLLYLATLATHPSNWFYNSQAWTQAANALNSLAKKKLIELHVKYHAQDGFGINIKRITPAGLNILQHVPKVFTVDDLKRVL